MADTGPGLETMTSERAGGTPPRQKPPPSLIVRRLAGIVEDSSASASAARGSGIPGGRLGSRAAAWLEAWSDPVAGVAAYSPCICTCNLHGDGDWKLVVADADKKLKVWTGGQKLAEHALLDTPVAIASFIPDASHPRHPSLAVAAGPHVFIFRNLRPYFRFTLPHEEVNPEEQAIWRRLMAGGLAMGEALTGLAGLQEAGGVQLTPRSLQLMNIGEASRKLQFIEQWQGQALAATTVITCMTTIRQAIDEPDAVSCLVLGTESGRVVVLVPPGTAVSRNVWVGTPPAALATRGELDLGHAIFVATRDGRVLTIRDGHVAPVVIQLDALVVGMTYNAGSGSLHVATMANAVHCYERPAGATLATAARKVFTLQLPCPVLAIQGMAVVGAAAANGLLVALQNGEVRVYAGKTVVCCHLLPSPVTGLWFGRYGREDNTLITVTKSGMVDVRILPRGAALHPPSSGPAPPPEQAVPLAVPKKTRLVLEQAAREREAGGAAAMHARFQKDLAALRLTVARAYVTILGDGKGAAAFGGSSAGASLSLRLAAHGLGPRFKVVLTLRNDGAGHVLGVRAVLSASPPHLYKLAQRVLLLPLLAPSLTYAFEVWAECVEPGAPPGSVTVMLLPPPAAASSVPLLQAQLRMPVSEVDDG